MIATLPVPYGRGLGAATRWPVIFAATGGGKLVDIQGLRRMLGEYHILSAAATASVGLALALAEPVLVLGLSWHGSLRLKAVGGMVLSLGDALLLSVTLLRGVDMANCGCFGVYWARPLRPWTPVEDLVLAGLALLVMAMPDARR